MPRLTGPPLLWNIFQHSPYSPNLVPSDFRPLPRLKEYLKGQKFEDDARMLQCCGWESLMKNVTLGNVTMSHRTRARRMPCVSLPLNYDRSAARSTRELVHSLQMYCKL
ncbi:hypothetical protein EVAR_98792_1, partial [Eumeta japonica]